MNNNQDYDQYYNQNDMYRQELQVDDRKVAAYVAKVMGWMCVGLLTTLVFSFLTLGMPALRSLVLGSRYGFTGVLIVQVAVALIFSFGINKMSPIVATVSFLLYSMLTGATFAVLFIAFQLSSLLFVFGLTSLVFLVMAVYGHVTKTDLTKLGSLLIFALFGIIIASVFNVFIMHSTVVELAICCIGIVIFIGLIAYDTQKIKAYYTDALASGLSDDSPAVRKLAIYGAFTLYLDFINLFLKLLRIFGKRRR